MENTISNIICMITSKSKQIQQQIMILRLWHIVYAKKRYIIIVLFFGSCIRLNVCHLSILSRTIASTSWLLNFWIIFYVCEMSRFIAIPFISRNLCFYVCLVFYIPQKGERWRLWLTKVISNKIFSVCLLLYPNGLRTLPYMVDEGASSVFFSASHLRFI